MTPIATPPAPAATPAASPTLLQAAGAAASANQPISAVAPGGPPGADPPPQLGSFSDLLTTARTAPAEGQTKKGQPVAAIVSADALGAMYLSAAVSPGAAPADATTATTTTTGTATATAAPPTGAVTATLAGATGADATEVAPAGADASSSAGAPESPSASASAPSPLPNPVPASGTASMASNPDTAVASANLGQVSSGASPDSAAAAAPPIPLMSAVTVGGVGAIPADSHLNHLTTFGGQQDAPAPRAATQPTAATPGQTAQSEQPREAQGRAAAAVSSAGSDTPSGAAPTTGTKVDPAATGKAEPTSDAKVDPAATAKVDPTANPANASTDVRGDQPQAASTAAGGSDVPVAQIDVTQTRATPGAQGASAPPAAVLPHPNLQNLNATLTTMSRQGLTQARLTLTPESLGGVKVVLTQTDNGLVARVIADHPEATQALAASAGELRRSLEANGTTLVSLEFGTGDGQGGGDARGGPSNGAAQYASQSGTAPAAGYGNLGDPTDDETTQTRQLTVALGDGSLVNVLA